LKKIFLIIIITTLSRSVNAQTGVADTLAYLQSIVANKAQYIGHSFHELADTMQIQIKFFSPFVAIHYDNNKETSTSFGFYFPQTEEEIYLTYPKK